MKKHSLTYLLAAGALCMSFLAVSCDDDAETGANDVPAVRSVLPTKVMEGQVVTITGTGLGNATAVVFPGGVRATDITKVGDGYIKATTPSGISADGGLLTVETSDGNATSVVPLSVGSPEIRTVAPLDKAIRINECVEVYGSDLEFITRVYFPGADGNDVAVDPTAFRRRSTDLLYIYSPMGVAAGPATVRLEDCSGRIYTLPEVTLSREIYGETTTDPLWTGSYEGSWSFLELRPSDLNLTALTPAAGQKLRFVFENTAADSRFCICLGEGWAAPNIGGESDPNNVSIANAWELTIDVTEEFATELNGGIIRIGGVNFTLVKIELFVP